MVLRSAIRSSAARSASRGEWGSTSPPSRRRRADRSPRRTRSPMRLRALRCRMPSFRDAVAIKLLARSPRGSVQSVDRAAIGSSRTGVFVMRSTRHRRGGPGDRRWAAAPSASPCFATFLGRKASDRAGILVASPRARERLSAHRSRDLSVQGDSNALCMRQTVS